eukprot:4202412-Heterocapsa_arctica.AAC.1
MAGHGLYAPRCHLAQHQQKGRHRREHHGIGIHLAADWVQKQGPGRHYGAGGLHRERAALCARRKGRRTAGGRGGERDAPPSQPQGVQAGLPELAAKPEGPPGVNEDRWKVHQGDHQGRAQHAGLRSRGDGGGSGHRGLSHQHDKG